MITGGNATIFVSNMDAAVQFYTGVLGMKLTNRFGDHWATVTAGNSLTIGLHPSSPKYPAPGTKGGIMLGLEIEGTIEQAIHRLAGKGVQMAGPIQRSEAGNFAHFFDPDGNEIYLWETVPVSIPDTELHLASETA